MLEIFGINESGLIVWGTNFKGRGLGRYCRLLGCLDHPLNAECSVSSKFRFAKFLNPVRSISSKFRFVKLLNPLRSISSKLRFAKVLKALRSISSKFRLSSPKVRPLKSNKSTMRSVKQKITKHSIVFKYQ